MSSEAPSPRYHLRSTKTGGREERSCSQGEPLAGQFLQQCEACGRALRLSVELVGRPVVCAHCGYRFLAATPSTGVLARAGSALRRAEKALRLRHIHAEDRLRQSAASAAAPASFSESIAPKTAIDDDKLRRRVWRFLSDRHVPGLETVRIRVAGGVVLLEGSVPNGHAKWLCRSCTRRVAGAIQVVDRLEIARIA